MKDLRQSVAEWNAWQYVCKELRRLGVEINDQNQLNADIRDWGKEFARLAKEHPQLLEE